jgi:hypothetical protein
MILIQTWKITEIISVQERSETVYNNVINGGLSFCKTVENSFCYGIRRKALYYSWMMVFDKSNLICASFL